MKNLYILLIIFLTACNNSTTITQNVKSWNNSSYINESSLLEVLVEKINFSSLKLDDFKKIGELMEMRRPSRAELSCDPTSVNCTKIKRILLSFSVPMKNLPKISQDSSSDISLIYEKISDIDCYQQFDHKNKYQTEPPLGCAVTSNIIKMVKNKEQFISPRLLSLQDAAGAIESIRKNR